MNQDNNNNNIHEVQAPNDDANNDHDDDTTATPSEYFSAWLDLTRIATEQLDGISTIRTFWNQKTRPDGRFWTQTRPVSIQHGILTTAAGSALVQIPSSITSKVVVLASVTLQVGQPSTVAPNQGDVLVTITSSETICTSLSSSSSSSSSSSILLQYQSFLQRLLEENLDLEQLLIVPGKAAFRLNIHVQLLQQAGNVLDACVVAIAAAVLDTQIPCVDLTNHVSTNKTGALVVPASAFPKDTNSKKKLQMNIIPISLTAIGVLVDAEEEEKDNDKNSSHFVWIVDPDGPECLAMNERNDHAIAHASVVVNAAQPSQILNLKVTTTNHDSNRQPPSQVTTSELASLMILGTKHAEKLFPILTPTNKSQE
jgi:exosome complex RNA-binding protein Rrp42 (RNase PH superfamily)